MTTGHKMQMGAAGTAAADDGGGAAAGSHIYTTSGSHTWTAPAGVTSVCVVAIGPGRKGGYNGCGGGGGGALGYINNYSVTPGNEYAVSVGQENSPASSTWGVDGGSTQLTAGGGGYPGNCSGQHGTGGVGGTHNLHSNTGGGGSGGGG